MVYTTEGASYVELELQFNERPYGGDVVVTGVVMMGATTISAVELRCRGVVDQIPDTPLTYTFTYRAKDCTDAEKDSNGQCIRQQLVSPLDSNAATVMLAPGEYLVDCSATDVHGATTTFDEILLVSRVTCDDVERDVEAIVSVFTFWRSLDHLDYTRNLLDVTGGILRVCLDLSEKTAERLYNLITQERPRVDDRTETTSITGHQRLVSQLFEIAASENPQVKALKDDERDNGDFPDPPNDGIGSIGTLQKRAILRRNELTSDAIGRLSSTVSTLPQDILTDQAVELIAVGLNSILQRNEAGVDAGKPSSQVDSIVSYISSCLVRSLQCNTSNRQLLLSGLSLFSARQELSDQVVELDDGTLFALPDNLERFAAAPGDCLGYQSAVFENSPFSFQNTELPLATRITSFSIADGQGEILEVKGTGPIQIHLLLNQQAANAYNQLSGPPPRDFLTCGAYDPGSGNFLKDGCNFIGITNYNGALSGVCICNHLTSFGALLNGGGGRGGDGGRNGQVLEDINDEIESLDLGDIQFAEGANAQLLGAAFGESNIELNTQGQYALRSDAGIDAS